MEIGKDGRQGELPRGNYPVMLNLNKEIPSSNPDEQPPLEKIEEGQWEISLRR